MQLVLGHTERQNLSTLPVQASIPSSQKSLSEKVMDYTIPFFEVLKITLSNCIFRIVNSAISLATLIFPKIFIPFLSKNSAMPIPITHEAIELNQIVFNQRIPPERAQAIKRKLHHLVDRFEQTRQRMRISQPIALYLSSNYQTALIGGPTSSPHALLSIQETMLYDELSTPLNQEINNDELDHVLAHELAHYKEDHFLKKTLLCILITLVDLLFLAIFPIGIIIAETIGTIAEMSLLRKFEKESDITSSKVLNTNRGAVSIFRKYLGQNLAIKNSTYQEMRTLLGPQGADLTPFRYHMIKLNFTNEGNERSHLYHPHLTDRLSYSVHFSPST